MGLREAVSVGAVPELPLGVDLRVQQPRGAPAISIVTIPRATEAARAPRTAQAAPPLCSGSPTYGQQEGSVYNGHFGCTCYHPLFVFNQFGDVERCALRRP
jgi:hypothetical protein